MMRKTILTSIGVAGAAMIAVAAASSSAEAAALPLAPNTVATAAAGPDVGTPGIERAQYYYMHRHWAHRGWRHHHPYYY